MSSSFGVVEEKLREASFFLDRLGGAKKLSLEAGYYFSAFVSASRSITFAMQSSMKGVDGFSAWYATSREKLKSDSIAPLFVDLRNDVVHKGVSPLNRAPIEHLRESVARQMRGEIDSHFICVPSSLGSDGTNVVDAYLLCTNYFRSLVDLVFDCYETFKMVVAPRWYFTEDNFRSRGLSLADAMEEQGLPRAWANCAPPGGDPWVLIRRSEPYCAVNDIFDRYLGKIIDEPN